VRARSAAGLIALAAALLTWPGAAGAAQLAKIGGFPQPTYVTAPPGDPHRLFVVEKGGHVELLHDGVRKQFLALGGDLLAPGEQGLLSMAFAPDYAKSGLFYVYYTARLGGDPNGDVLTLVEYRRSAADADRADPASRRVVLSIDHPSHFNHNGGQLQFGPDGLLYLGPGDGGGGNDQNGNPATGNAQDKSVLLGKLLRIDPRQNGTAAYSVPASNPFVGEAGAAPEIYAYGLRNPWRFSFDRLTGDLVVADVGQDQREEVDFAPHGSGAGANYGWRCREGLIATPGLSPPCTPAGAVDPVFDYDHSGGRCAITGGYVVRNHDLDSLYGRYVYADYCGGDIRSMALAAPVTDDSSTGLARTDIYSFGEDSCGHLYVTTGGGEVDLIVDRAFTPCPAPPPGGGGGKKDVTPPKLKLTSAAKQRLGRLRSVYLSVSCDESCAVTASAKLSVPGAKHAFKIAPTGRALGARKAVRLQEQLGRRAADEARRAAGRGARVLVFLRVVARDAAGNQSVATRTVRVVD
jgi:glucose/arabinose dehydrogenase